MFDYKDLFDSFNLPPTDEDIAIQMLYDCQNMNDDQFCSTQTSKPVDPSDIPSTSRTHDHNGDWSTDEDDDVYQDASNNNVDTIEHNLDTSVTVPTQPTTRIHTNHPQDNIIGDPNVGVKTRRQMTDALVSLYSNLRDQGDLDYWSTCAFISQLNQKATRRH